MASFPPPWRQEAFLVGNQGPPLVNQKEMLVTYSSGDRDPLGVLMQILQPL